MNNDSREFNSPSATKTDQSKAPHLEIDQANDTGHT